MSALVVGIAVVSFLLFGRSSARPRVRVSADCRTVTEDPGWFDNVFGPRANALMDQFVLDDSLLLQYLDWSVRAILKENGVGNNCLNFYPWFDRWNGDYASYLDEVERLRPQFPALFGLITKCRSIWFASISGTVTADRG